MAPGGCRGPRGVAGVLCAAGAAGVSRAVRGLAVPPPPGRCGSLPRGAWPGGRGRAARSPALPRGARSSRGGAPAAGRASAQPPTGRCTRDPRRSRAGPHSMPSGPAGRGTCRWGCRSPSAGTRGRVGRAEGRVPARSRPSARAAAKSRFSITIARAPCCPAEVISALMAARSRRPGRWPAARPGPAGWCAGVPRTLPSGATTAMAR